MMRFPAQLIRPGLLIFMGLGSAKDCIGQDPESETGLQAGCSGQAGNLQATTCRSFGYEFTGF